MPRRPRLFVPGCLHHVMARGIDGLDIFRDDDDRTRFVTLLAKYALQSEVRCYAWALMRNHYHLVIRTSALPLSALMKPLNSRYAAYFNKRARRRGYLFQDRFKSVATQDQLYLEQMIRYVHLNPVRGGVCRDLDELDKYRWSGHAALMGTHPSQFQDTGTVLRRFGHGNQDGRARYREFLQQAVDSEGSAFVDLLRSSSSESNDRSNAGMWVIGDRDFVKQAMGKDRERRMAVARYAREGWDMERVCKHVASHLNIDPASMQERGRGDTRSVARSIAAYLGHRHLEIPVSNVARHLGVGQPAASAMIAKGVKAAADHGVAISD